jgi:hypothetical protein
MLHPFILKTEAEGSFETLVPFYPPRRSILTGLYLNKSPQRRPMSDSTSYLENAYSINVYNKSSAPPYSQAAKGTSKTGYYIWHTTAASITFFGYFPYFEKIKEYL